MEWTDKMYQFLAWRVLLDVHETTARQEKEKSKIESFAGKISENLSSLEKKFVEHRARQMKNDYYEFLLGTLERMYQSELRDEDHEEWHIATRERKFANSVLTDLLTQNLPVESLRSSNPAILRCSTSVEKIFLAKMGDIVV